MTAVSNAARSLRWYLRQLTGEAKWDEYTRECATHGHEPMSRREFERRRDDEREGLRSARCC